MPDVTECAEARTRLIGDAGETFHEVVDDLSCAALVELVPMEPHGDAESRFPLAAVDLRRHDDAQRVGRGVEPGDAVDVQARRGDQLLQCVLAQRERLEGQCGVEQIRPAHRAVDGRESDVVVVQDQRVRVLHMNQQLAQ